MYKPRGAPATTFHTPKWEAGMKSVPRCFTETLSRAGIVVNRGVGEKFRRWGCQEAPLWQAVQVYLGLPERNSPEACQGAHHRCPAVAQVTTLVGFLAV